MQPNAKPAESKSSPVPELERLITNLNHTAMEYLRRDFFNEARECLFRAEHFLGIAKSFSAYLIEQGEVSTEADLKEMRHQLCGLTYNNFGCVEKS
jgi:hypothetical protein